MCRWGAAGRAPACLAALPPALCSLTCAVPCCRFRPSLKTLDDTPSHPPPAQTALGVHMRSDTGDVLFDVAAMYPLLIQRCVLH